MLKNELISAAEGITQPFGLLSSHTVFANNLAKNLATLKINL